MSAFKLNTLLQSKEPGDTWQTIRAPERYLFWTAENEWPDSFKESFGVSLRAVRILGGGSDKPVTAKYTSKNRLYLDCGVDILNGYVTTTSRKSIAMTLRVDGTTELNMAMRELSTTHEIESWQIQNIEIFNAKENSIVKFSRHNPDSNGIDLYLLIVNIFKKELWYPEISLFDQQRYCAKFQYHFAHCSCEIQEIKSHACALRKNLPAQGVKLRKSNKEGNSTTREANQPGSQNMMRPQ